MSAGPGEEFVLLGIPDVNGSIRGKALRPDAFDSAVEHGTVMTDLILGLDPVDTPIADYERFGIRTGAADLIVHPDVETLRDLAWRPELARRFSVRLRNARGPPAGPRRRGRSGLRGDVRDRV
jgi:glutamine synthetase